jgi:hypothetical protein
MPNADVLRRFNDRAKRVVVLAQEEARMLNHNYIGTEHILLGLIHEGEDVAAKVLRSFGIALEGMRKLVEEITGRGQQAPSGVLPFTRSVKKALELSLYGRPCSSATTWLLSHLGEGQVFMDVESIELGVDFAEAISAAVGQCDVLIAVIGQQWSNTRLEDADDIVRLEVEAALNRNIRVIPVLVDSAELPGKQDLPSLATLVRLNTLRIRHESFRQDVRRLLEAVKTPD